MALRTFLKLINLTWKTRVPPQWRKAEVFRCGRKGNLQIVLIATDPFHSQASAVKLLRKWFNADFGSFWNQKAQIVTDRQVFKDIGLLWIKS
ncbi:hypothetical protein TNCT_438771 [Trichonephila clavata]|uniref:Uncharacterized protein n=1 Tax=Trichonephila clavata TaxID=2740835 RepID=A0A8X6L2I8_TRICU|nr:hypothetical protein TNCT_438771 [Trichonephila clavata]